MCKVTVLAATVAFLFATSSVPYAIQAHEDHGTFSAGEPGDPKKPARVVKVKMIEEGKKMLFEPALIEIRRGEQIRFILANSCEDGA